MPTPEPPRNLYQDARMPHLANEHAFQAPPPHPFSPFEVSLFCCKSKALTDIKPSIHHHSIPLVIPP
ncbi:hypothetical protein M011DRAFT_471289 [Sporormia fimetaria CBS 119925]|uniref:Uncharacterized protein n=1 Tax=Sporormia fimetaria CBS 119925 TaxID=1340428 RepID=A0A6A6V162_9PLEO|nr:hypothetical protein M011DRAFT_471289 [Sporormia fimetaria CBS 119925]